MFKTPNKVKSMPWGSIVTIYLREYCRCSFIYMKCIITFWPELDPPLSCTPPFNLYLPRSKFYVLEELQLSAWASHIITDHLSENLPTTNCIGTITSHKTFSFSTSSTEQKIHFSRRKLCEKSNSSTEVTYITSKFLCFPNSML
jgi:hypothetical protein